MAELCWPLSKETEGLPGSELADFRRLHHQVWKMFEPAEDLMTEDYLAVLSTSFSLQVMWELIIAERYSAAVTARATNAC